jgi:hypothetical protein
MFVGENVDVATSPTVASGGRAMWLELLSVKGDTAISASSWIRQCSSESRVGRCTAHTCAHMYNEVIEESFALRIE